MFMIVVAAAAATVAPASYAVPETAEEATSPWGPHAVAVAEVSSWTVAVRKQEHRHHLALGVMLVATFTLQLRFILEGVRQELPATPTPTVELPLRSLLQPTSDDSGGCLDQHDVMVSIAKWCKKPRGDCFKKHTKTTSC